MIPPTPAPCPAPPLASSRGHRPAHGPPQALTAKGSCQQGTRSRWGREGRQVLACKASAAAARWSLLCPPEGLGARPSGWEEPSALRGWAWPTPGATAPPHAPVGRAHGAREQDTRRRRPAAPDRPLRPSLRPPTPRRLLRSYSLSRPPRLGPSAGAGAQARTLRPAWAPPPQHPFHTRTLTNSTTTGPPRHPSPGGGMKTTTRNCPSA